MDTLAKGLEQVQAEVARLRRLMMPLTLVFEGDSLTYGVGSNPGNDYPSQCTRLLGGDINVFNQAVGGSTLTQDIPGRMVMADGFFDPQRLSVYVLWAGTNDMKALERPAAEVFELYRQNMLQRRAKGFKTVAVTILPRSSPSTSATFEPNRQAFNGLLRAGWKEFADVLADIAADERIGDEGDQHGSYFSDGVHLNDAGYYLVAQAVAKAIESI